MRYSTSSKRRGSAARGYFAHALRASAESGMLQASKTAAMFWPVIRERRFDEV